mmetsp:Transcript_14706/g.22799  ORF Transcript_14706/g.22799 Transcript_14706/m.22799 type:complete len:124 (+) Transcript_14706:622-993(+)
MDGDSNLMDSWMAIDVGMGTPEQTQKFYLTFDLPYSLSYVQSPEVSEKYDDCEAGDDGYSWPYGSFVNCRCVEEEDEELDVLKENQIDVDAVYPGDIYEYPEIYTSSEMTSYFEQIAYYNNAY